MRPTFTILVLTLAALALTEGLAWWWMNPAAATTGEPVLAYRPQGSAGVSPANQNSGARGQGSGVRDQESGIRNAAGAVATHTPGEAKLAWRERSEGSQEEAPAPATSPNQKSKFKNQDSKISSSLSPSSPIPQSSISPSSTDNRQQTTANSPTISSTAHRSLLTAHSPISASQHFSVSASTHTPLPEIYRQAAPMLRCTSGEVFHVQIHDSASLHGAFFEWDGTDTGSVLEAFRHMPEACMGAIGMKLVSKEKPILYTVRGQECGRSGSDLNSARSQNGMARAKRGQSGDRSQEEVAASSSAPSSNQKSKIKNQDSKISPSSSSSSLTDNRQPTTDNASSLSSSNQKSKIKNQDSKISPSSSSSSLTDNRQPTTDNSSTSSSTDHRSLLTDHSLVFDHTVFRDPGQGRGPLGPGPLVHAFRAVWVAGLSSADARSGLDGRQFDQLRSIRLHSALTRFRPAHARVIQGAVRGFHTPEAAWQAFEQHMLRDLTFDP